MMSEYSVLKGFVQHWWVWSALVLLSCGSADGFGTLLPGSIVGRPSAFSVLFTTKLPAAHWFDTPLSFEATQPARQQKISRLALARPGSVPAPSLLCQRCWREARRLRGSAGAEDRAAAARAPPRSSLLRVCPVMEAATGKKEVQA